MLCNKAYLTDKIHSFTGRSHLKEQSRGREQERQREEECFKSERDELEVAKKDIIEYLKYRCDYIFKLRGKDRGKSVWHYVLIDPDKKEAFLEQSKAGSIDAADYGKILYSGCGENPPQNIIDKVDKFFDEKKISNDLFVIKEEHKGKSLYHYVFVYPDKKEMFQERSKTDPALVREIEDYGRVLYSGWGQDPHESISDRIEREYFCTNGRSLEGEFANLSVKALHDAARNKEVFQERSKRDPALVREIEDYGRVLYSGWGQDLHESISDRIERAYFCMDERDLEGEFADLSVKALHDAARNGELGTVRDLMRKGVNVNIVFSKMNDKFPLWYYQLEAVSLYIGALEV